MKQLESDEARMRTAYLAAMDQLGIDVLAFPTATYRPKLNGDRNTTPAGTLSGIASALHWPAAVVPMGYSHESLPSGLQLLGRPWSEPILIELAHAYEQATQHARPAEHRACRTETVAVQEQHDLPNYPLLRPSDRQNALQPQLSLACKPFRCVR